MGSTRTNVYGPELQCRTEWGTGTGNHSGKGGGCRVWWHLASSNGCMCPCDGSHWHRQVYALQYPRSLWSVLHFLALFFFLRKRAGRLLIHNFYIQTPHTEGPPKEKKITLTPIRGPQYHLRRRLEPPLLSALPCHGVEEKSTKEEA